MITIRAVVGSCWSVGTTAHDAVTAWPPTSVATRRLKGLGGRPLAPGCPTIPPLPVQPLSGGLTNRNYRVITHHWREIVVRLSAEQSSLLQIDRDAEHRNAVAAACAGVG